MLVEGPSTWVPTGALGSYSIVMHRCDVFWILIFRVLGYSLPSGFLFLLLDPVVHAFSVSSVAGFVGVWSLSETSGRG